MFLVAVCVSAYADTANQKGKATVTYADPMATPDVKAKALLAAEMKAVDAYYAGLGDAAAESQDAIMDQIKADPDRYILNYEVLDESDSPANHQYTVVVRVTLHTSRLKLALKSKTNAQVASTGSTRSPLGFIFLSRATDSQTVYDAHVYKRVDTSSAADAKAASSHKGTEGESVSKGQVSTNASVKQTASASTNASATTESGGSTTTKSATATYRILPSANLSQSVSKEFNTAGFRVNEAALIEPYTNGKLKVSAIEKDYSTGNDLKSGTLANVVAGLRTAQFRYFAIATLDVGQATQDPATGMERVAVIVNAKVLDVGQTIPENVAVAGPTQYAAVGPTEDEARTAALSLAAQSTARELTSQLSNAGIH